MQAHPLFALNGLTIFFGWWVFRLGGYVSLLGYKWVDLWHMVGWREVPTLACWVAGAVLQVLWGGKISLATFKGLQGLLGMGAMAPTAKSKAARISPRTKKA
jgi:hypothetical protein